MKINSDTAPLTPVLTPTMQPIIEAVGFDAALRLVARHGGTRVWLAADPDARDPLSMAIGLAMARALVLAVGSGPLEVPRCLAWLIARRNEEIVARYDGGESQASLALKFNLTERHIRNVLREEGADGPVPSPQTDLFTEGVAS